MKKYNHIAVMIRGLPRTWDYAKHSIFYTYEKIAFNVDYYFSTWDYDYIDEFKIRSDFIGKKLIAFIKCPVVPEFRDVFRSPGWFSYNLIPYKRFRESEVKYDAIFDQRTDCINYIFGDHFDVLPDTYYTEWVCPEQKPIRHVCDCNFVCDSKTYEKIALRFLKTEMDLGQVNWRDPIFDWSNAVRSSNIADSTGKTIVLNTEAIVFNYLTQAGLEIKVKRLINSLLCRPSMMKLCPDPLQIMFLPRPWEWFLTSNNGSYDKWNSFTSKEKELLCLEYNINPKEYFL